MVDGVLVKEEIVAVQVDGDIEHAFGAADAADVIDVRVREQNGANLQALTVDERQQIVDLIAGVDQDGLEWSPSDDVAVLEEGSGGGGLQNHGVSISIPS